MRLFQASFLASVGFLCLVPAVTDAQTGAIVGRVVKDVNGNGIQDAGEPFIRTPGSSCAGGEAIAGFTVMWSGQVSGSAGLLQCPGGEPSYTSGTVPNGSYTMSLVVPAGWQITKSTAQTTNVPGGPDPWFYVRPPAPPGAIVGRIVEDLNGDGVQQSNEPYIRAPASSCGTGVAVAGFSVQWSGTAVGSTGVTSCADGQPSYTSGTVPAGNYGVSLVVPAGWQITKSTAQTTTVPGGPDPWFYVRPPAPSTGVIIGRIVEDLNGDGLQQSNEPFIRAPESSCGTGVAVSGFAVQWSGTASGTTGVTACVDGQPSYTSGTVPTGSYSMSLVVPGGWTVTKSTAQTTTVPGGPDPWFYVHPTAPPSGVIIGRVVNDLNGDGIAQPGEPYIRTPGSSCKAGQEIPGFTVNWNGPVGGEIGMLECVDGQPSYSSGTVPAGAYAMSVNTPAGWQVTKSTMQSTTVPGGGDPWFLVHNTVPPQSADPAISMFTSSSQVTRGDDVFFSMLIHNNGNAAAAGVKVTSTMVAGLQFVPSTSDPRCTGTAVIVCQIGSLAAGASSLVMLEMKTLEGGRPQQTAVISSTTGDADASNNSATAGLIVLPDRLEAPDTTQLQGADSTNRHLPTIVLTHGWSLEKDKQDAKDGHTDVLWLGTGANQASNLVDEALRQSGQGANVLRFVWLGAFTQTTGTFAWLHLESEYKQARQNVEAAGQALGERLLEALGPDYAEEIQFVGHSLGSAVNAIGAQYFLSHAPHVPRVRFTALDRPDNLIGIHTDFMQGFGADYFVTKLDPVKENYAPNLDLKIENIYATTGAHFGAPSIGSNLVPAYNRSLQHPSWLSEPFFNEGDQIDHSGVQLWYRLTVKPTIGGLTYCDGPNWRVAGDKKNVIPDRSLNPCELGWSLSLFGALHGELPEPLDRTRIDNPETGTLAATAAGEAWRAGVTGPAVLRSATSALVLSNFQNIRGCSMTADAGGTISCVNTSQSLGMAAIDVPTDSAYLSFEYRFTATSSTDHVALLIDGAPVWMLGATSAAASTFQLASGIPIRGLSGSRTLTVAYYGSDAAAGGQADVRNLRASGGVPLRQFLAEGATGSFFDTRIALLNPNTQPTNVQLTFQKDDGTTVSTPLSLPAHTRATVYPRASTGMTSASFSTVIEAGLPIIADRQMTWGESGYGSHAETAIPDAATTWYLAEGSTSGDFTLFYLLQNPQSTEVTATIRYLRPLGFPPIERIRTLPPHSRTTIQVDAEGPELASTDLSAVITATAPIIVERSMYRSSPTQPFAAGHDSAGVTAPATQWFLAEGATGPFFDLFILLANPTAVPAHVRVDYLLSTGTTLSKEYDVPANGRYTIWVDDEELPAGSGLKPLNNVAVSSTITSTNNVPIIVERTMWWPSPETTPDFWTEAHNSPGATETATRWGLADGEVGGPQAAETFILIANTSTYAGQARVTLYFEDGTLAEKVVDLKPSSRTNVNVSMDFPEAAGRRFGSVVESIGDTPAQIVVERSMYTSPNGQVWAAGTNVLGVRF